MKCGGDTDIEVFMYILVLVLVGSLCNILSMHNAYSCMKCMIIVAFLKLAHQTHITESGTSAVRVIIGFDS